MRLSDKTWRDSPSIILRHAELCFLSGRYGHACLACHDAVEILFRQIFRHRVNDVAPRTNDLKFIARMGSFLYRLNHEQRVLIDQLSAFNQDRGKPFTADHPCKIVDRNECEQLIEATRIFFLDFRKASISN